MNEDVAAASGVAALDHLGRGETAKVSEEVARKTLLEEAVNRLAQMHQ